MEAVGSEALLGDERNPECRVQVTSKISVINQIDQYKNILKTALDGQRDMEEETKRGLLQELLVNFEAAVLDNVLVNGQPWEEASDVEALESLLDDTIVETTWRRRSYPRQILPHVVHALKAERKLMGQYEHRVKPADINHLDQGAAMNDLTVAAPVMVKQAIQVIKSIGAIQKHAEGLCAILNMKSSPTTLEIHREVFNLKGQSDPLLPLVTKSRQTMKRAVEHSAASDCYVSVCKKMASIVTQQ